MARRSGRSVVAGAKAVVVLAACSGASAVGANGAIKLDLYRAMAATDIEQHDIENNDLASVAGVMKYVHTEAIAEHQISPKNRTSRKYGIDVIARWPFVVKNPAELLDPSSSSGRTTMATQVDFGPYTTFDHGVATNTIQQSYVADYGDFVGVQLQKDLRFTYSDPYFWFSVSGFCPNLNWTSKGTAESPAEACLNYTAGGKVQGGLCDNWREEDSMPTGEPGCAYVYRNASVVDLDDLANVTGQDCGGRTCQDWADFRLHCSDTSLRRYFDANTGAVLAFPYCVEYDISPKCAASCEAPACQELADDEKELGLPFWKGRCSDSANKRRAESLAAKFGAEGEHAVSTTTLREEREQCYYPGGMCLPDSAAGGMYCSRAWAGVCQPCRIPGTTSADQLKLTKQPYCPFTVLGDIDYAGKASLAPSCSSSAPRDWCCLYTASCSGPWTVGNVSSYPLDEDGYALAVFAQNTSVMKGFLERAATELVHGSVEDGRLQEIAYWEWDHYPREGWSLASAQATLAHYAEPFPTTRTTTTTSTGTTTIHQGMVPIAGATPKRALLALVHLCVATALAVPAVLR